MLRFALQVVGSVAKTRQQHAARVDESEDEENRQGHPGPLLPPVAPERSHADRREDGDRQEGVHGQPGDFFASPGVEKERPDRPEEDEADEGRGAGTRI